MNENPRKELLAEISNLNLGNHKESQLANLVTEVYTDSWQEGYEAAHEEHKDW